MTQLAGLSLTAFADETASASPAPGGGSVAAYAGAMAAALVAMVCRLTAAKAGFEAARDDMAAMGAAAQGLQAKLLHNVDADTEAYLRIVAAYRLPKESADDEAARSQAIAAALRHAAEVPLATAALCLEVLELAARLSGSFNTATASDLGVALQSAMCGVQGGALNVAINLQGLPDDGSSAELRRRIGAIEADARRRMAQAWPVVRDLAMGAGQDSAGS